jgi:hypothetical protein
LFGSKQDGAAAGGVHFVQPVVARLQVVLAILQPDETRDRGAAEVNFVLRSVDRLEGNRLVGFAFLRQRPDRPVRYGRGGIQYDDGVFFALTACASNAEYAAFVRAGVEQQAIRLLKSCLALPG